MNKGQTWVEFIISTVVFLFVISFFLFSAIGHFGEESEKAIFQANCLKADALENFLQQPGRPADWHLSGVVQNFGLGDNRTNVILHSKWLEAKEIGYPTLIENSTPEDSWHLSYSVYAFDLTNVTTCRYGNAVTLCRGLDTLNITANTTRDNNTRVELTLFFPLTVANVTSNTLDNRDRNLTSQSSAGTEISAVMNINVTDQDIVNITTFGARPELVFVKKSFIDSTQNITFLLGNVSMAVEFGALTVEQRGLCTKRTKAAINLTSELALADFELAAW